MRRAKAEELKSEAIPVLTAHLSEPEFRNFFPVETDELDALAEAEPSIGALIQLECGSYVVVIYGKTTGTMKLLLPQGTEPGRGLDAVLAEVPLPLHCVEWRCDAESVSSTGS